MASSLGRSSSMFPREESDAVSLLISLGELEMSEVLP